MEESNNTKTDIPSVTKDISSTEKNIADCEEESDREQTPEDAEPERGNWTGRFDFLLSLLGYSVGLGNVWRFPYLCYNNGGGAFLIPFTVMLIIAGLPLMFMELSFGQYAALGPVAVYNKFCPLFQGLGYGMVIVSSIVMLYYNLIIAWTIYYMAVSFKSIFYQLPWQNCDADWSTEHCYSYEEADSCDASNGTYYLRQCINQTYSAKYNIAALADVALRRPPAEEYFTNQVLGLSSGIEETGQIRLGMAICLFAAWLIVFLCLCKGVQSSGKVVYFTALFPYVVLVILFFRGVTLPGASTGILFYLTPDFSQLLNAQVWGDAAVQIFFALSPAWGGLITLSSYNKFSNNCYLDSLIVAVSNIATSFFAGLVIFSVIGFLAHELNVSVDRVVDQGAGLAFIVYPEVVTRLPVSPLWSILFFVMLLTLGLDSQFALMETVTTAILDRFPNYRQKKVWVVFFVAVLGYIGGLIFTTNSGMYWLQLMDKYAANWSVLIIAIGECILIAWIYGAEKFCGDIQKMIGRQSKLWVYFWSAMWRIITPAALVFILVFNWIEYKPASYASYVYPMWADAVGWTIGVLPVVVVVLMAVDQICSGPDDLTIMETSQDGGDTTSITSGIENEIKKPGCILKSKRTSIKRKVQSLSHESDDAVIEPLLQKDKEKTDLPNQSAKFDLMSKTKTDTSKDDKEKLLQDDKIQNIKDTVTSSPISKSAGVTAPLHNHMNTNVFSNHDALKGLITPKSQILVEIEGTKQSGYNPSPLIFTTAKIHTDGKTKNMEPLQVTPVPILSTIEVSCLKNTSINNNGEVSGLVGSNISSTYVKIPKSNVISDKDEKLKSTAPISTVPNNTKDNKTLLSFDKKNYDYGTSVKDTKISNASIVDKEFNKFAPTNLKDSKDAKKMSTEINTITSEKSGKQPKIPPSKITSEINPKTVAVNDPIKTAISTTHSKSGGIINQTVVKDDDLRKSDLNKNIKCVDNHGPGQSGEFDLKSDGKGQTGAKQLQRQKVAIDKEDPILKSNIGSSPINNDPKLLKQSGENKTFTDKSIIHTKSPLSDKILSKSSADNDQISNSTTRSNPSSANITVTGNKSASSHPTNYTVKSNITSNNPISVTKSPTLKNSEVSNSFTVQATLPLSINTTSASSSNSKIANATSIKPSPLTTSNTKSINVSTIATLTSSSQPLTVTSTAKTAVTAPKIIPTTCSSSISTTIAKTASISVAKNPPTLANTVKSTPTVVSGNHNVAKNVTTTPSSTKFSSASNENVKITNTLINVAKNAPSSNVKNPSVSTDTKSTPASASSGKNPVMSIGITKSHIAADGISKSASSTMQTKTTTAAKDAKSTPAVTKLTKSSPVTTSAPKSTAMTTSVAKSPSGTNSVIKLSTSKTNATPTNKGNVTTSKPTGTSTTVATTGVSAGSTSKPAVSNKKDEAKSSELGKTKKSVKT